MKEICYENGVIFEEYNTRDEILNLYKRYYKKMVLIKYDKFVDVKKVIKITHRNNKLGYPYFLALRRVGNDNCLYRYFNLTSKLIDFDVFGAFEKYYKTVKDDDACNTAMKMLGKSLYFILDDYSCIREEKINETCVSLDSYGDSCIRVGTTYESTHGYYDFNETLNPINIINNNGWIQTSLESAKNACLNHLKKIEQTTCDKLVNSIFHEGDKVILPYSYVEKNRYIITSYAEAEFRKAENGKVYGYYTDNYNRTQYVELATSKEFLKCWTKAK